ncbi:hypothetical protein Mycch_6005 (plasmid) [Mycolicibacterium chubuense NBB4]|uniref:Uncharacterized protein n=1 Tax=Mycolicibacterium chubuense (strain NBB4) TaxID=710421 RepID=I4BTK0_MYCCN|nr:hypothetical protein [Mycolicibacterium chubuense]AFM20607.1 hypothetical protein Mycch_6005 [Mycolicibacterium chubuense NBB4]
MSTVPWSLTTTTADRVSTVIGRADNHQAAITAVLVTALEAIHTAWISESPEVPRYELRADNTLVALVQTGSDDQCRPDHADAAALIARIDTARTLTVSPY